MASACAHAFKDSAIEETENNANETVTIQKSMQPFVESEMIHLENVATNFIARQFEFCTIDPHKKINVVQMMSEYQGNFSTPVCYLRFFVKRAGTFVRCAEELKTLSRTAEMNRLNCIRMYQALIQHYSEVIGAIQSHESYCQGRSFRKSTERMQSNIGPVPINLRLQQLLVSSSVDPSQRSIYNTITLGAPAVHHFRFANGGLRKIKENLVETNERLYMLQEKFQDVLVLNADIEEALDYLFLCIGTAKITKNSCQWKASLERVLRSITALVDHSQKNLQAMTNATSLSVVNPWANVLSTDISAVSNNSVYQRTRQILDEMTQLLQHSEADFNRVPLDNLRSIADELERETCGQLLRFIFQESEEIERYPRAYRERFDIAFSQTLTCLVFSIYVLLSSGEISDQAWKLYINNGILISFEYLLTCDSDEMGMLEDCIEAVQALEHVQIRFFLETNNHTFLQPRFFGTRFYCKISIPLPSHLFVRLPETLMDGNVIRIVPVLFNIGIDHRALFAQVLSLSLFSGLQVEFDLNLQNFRKLKAYIAKSLTYLPDGIAGMMRLLEQTFRVRKAKNVEILSLTEQICRAAFGIRVTGCKSAKDRTSMGFTLEQGRLLIKRHKMKKHDLQEILNQLRRNGTSIENAFGNTGIRAYAFGYIQLLAFPEFYRAQPGTYSESET